MAGGRLIVSPEADTDLAAIVSFITDRDGMLRAAEALERIQRTMHNLAFMPGMGRHRFYLDKDVRAFSVAPWTIYYVQRSDGDGIEVVRVIDGRRDLPAIFGKSKKKR